MSKEERISIRLTDNQMLVLNELKTYFKTSYSVLIRAIIQDFLERNDDALERIITNKIKKENGLD